MSQEAIIRQIRKLWHLSGTADSANFSGGWTLPQYQDYHLSLYCFLEAYARSPPNSYLWTL